MGHATRAHALKRALPKELRRADKILTRAEGELTLASLPVQTPPPPPDPVAVASPAAPPQVPEPRREESSSPPVPHGPLSSVLSSVLGPGGITPERIDELERLAHIGLVAPSREAELRRQRDAAENGRTAEEDQHAQTRELLDQAQLDHALSQDELSSARDKVRWLQAQLVSRNAADIAYQEVPDEACASYPPSLADLWQWLCEEERLAHVRYTGESAPIKELSDFEGLGAWAISAWDALLALDDYARYKREQEFSGGVHLYLGNTPDGYRTVSPKNHASKEGARTETNRKWRRLRTLPVPEEVHPDGEVFMEAHFKIGARRSISPRMHYYDAVTSTGFVYVGYLGRHLENAQSN